MERKSVAVSVGLVTLALAVTGCSPSAGSQVKAAAAKITPWSVQSTAVTTSGPTRVVATPSSTPTQSMVTVTPSSPAQPGVVPTAAVSTAQPTPTPLSPAAAQVEHDGYSLIGQAMSNGYPVALGQNQSGDEELVETWPSNLLAQEELAQYFNADGLMGLSDVSLSVNVDLLIASGPASEINTILNNSSLGASL